MKIFKFGGASTKDADGIKNVVSVLTQTGESDLVLIISAIGKTTNALEKVVDDYFSNPAHLETSMDEVNIAHFQIATELFKNPSHSVFSRLKAIFKEMETFLKTNKSDYHPFVYDQIVSFGEILATEIVAAYLLEVGIQNTLLDVRECIKTDANYRDAKVDWEITQKSISEKVNPTGITVTQGFLGSESANNFTTTLGREGSDYTAAIFAYCLNAENVTIWKDVPGVLNADPRYFENAQLLNHISYKEAIELAFYGASVIHPKTLQPLQRKEIPLFVKSFLNPMAAGTCVGKGVLLDPMVSCFILKKNLVLVSLSSLDFSFIMEDSISDVFKWLYEHKMKVELIQNSAISFSFCVENKFNNLEAFLTKLREKFSVTWNEGVTLYTIRHYQPSEIKSISKGKTVLLKQESRETAQLVILE